IGVAVGVAVGVLAWRPARLSPLAGRGQLSIAPADSLNPSGLGLLVLSTAGSRTALAWSPDGQSVAFVGERAGVRQIYVRAIAGDQAKAIAGTEGAGAFAFSPDGSEIAFGGGGALRRVKVA